MKALVIYDDLFIALAAKATLERATHHANAATQWDIRPWRIEMLKFTPTAEEALSDAADAHLMVFAVGRTPSLSVWLMAWLKRWATLRQVPDSTLAVIGDAEAKPLLVPLTFELSQFARRHGLGFICGDHGGTGCKRVPAGSALNKRKLPVFPAPPCFVNMALYDIYRGWGIND